MKRPITSKQSFPSERFLFCTVFVLELLHILYIVLSNRLGIHDTFGRFVLQYNIFNNAVTAGEIPQWIPFITHGNAAYPFYSLWGSSNLLTNVLLYAGRLLEGANFLAIFNWGIFIEKIILLLGVWLLAKRFFASSLTVFFVTISVLGSCVWLTQAFFNFYLFYTIPLILYLMHRFLDGGDWRYLFLAANLFALQAIGGLIYFIPMALLTIFLYFFFYIICDFKNFAEKFKSITWQRPSLLHLGLTLLSFAVVLGVMQFGFDDHVLRYTVERNLDGSVPIDAFLTYGSEQKLYSWIELFIGISPGIDFTLYIGLLSVPLIIFGVIFNFKKQNSHFYLLVLTLALFTLGTFVTKFFYYIWPLMKFFRHIALVSSMVKMFLCFLASFGFESVFVKGCYRERPRAFLYTSMFIILLLTNLLLYLDIITNHRMYAFEILATLGHNLTILSYALQSIIETRFTIASALSFIFLVIFVCLFIIGARSSQNFVRYQKWIIFTVLFFHMLDIYVYAFYETNTRSSPLAAKQIKTMQLQPPVYSKHRSTQVWDGNPREIIFASLLNAAGTRYWIEDSFLFKDRLHSPMRTEHWSRSLDNFMRAYWGQPLDNPSIRPAGYNNEGLHKLEFPTDHPAVTKIVGVDEEKIQFFSNAYPMPTKSSVAELMTHPKYKGDILFLLASGDSALADRSSHSWPADKVPSEDMRLRLPYEIKRFDANHLEVMVTVPEGQPNAWMLYSDAWHPRWKAAVNGHAIQVFQANLAYKAVPLAVGENNVHFYFGSQWFSLLHVLLALNSLFWLVAIFAFAGKIVLGSPEHDEPKI